MNIAFLSRTGYTERFVNKLAPQHVAFPVADGAIPPTGPLVFVLPSYQHHDPLTIDFVIDRWPDFRGVIGTGNRAFGKRFCWAARDAAALSDAPMLYEVEMFGTPEDVDAVNKILDQLDQETD